MLPNRDLRMLALAEWLEFRKVFDNFDGHSLAADLRDLMEEVERLREELRKCKTRGPND